MDKETIDQYIAELKEVSKKYGLAIIGTCDNEGIYGEITIVSTSSIEESEKPYLFNFYVDVDYSKDTGAAKEHGQDGAELRRYNS